MPPTRGAFEAWPMDFLLLEKLPDQGLIGGLHYRGRKAKELVRELSNSEVTLTVSQVQARLRALKLRGFVKDYPASGGASGGTRIWARTPAGVELMGRRDTELSL